MKRSLSKAFALGVIAALLAGCARPQPPPSPFARAEQIEEDFRSQTFVLGNNDQVAEVREPDWPKDRFLRIQFWLGINILVPGVLAPKEGDYYVVSEATLIKQLEPNTWLIQAGSHLVKQEAVFVATNTNYVTTGKILPIIVQFAGMRTFPIGGGKSVQLPILRQVSLPMKWDEGGLVGYARSKKF